MAGPSEAFDQEEISIIQTRQLRKSIHYIYQRSPFYRDLMDREGLLPTDIKTLSDLRYLPTTCKADMMREGDRFLCVRPEEVAEIMTSLENHHNTLYLKATEDDLARIAYNEQLSFKVAGITSKDCVAVALTMDDCTMAGMAYYFGLRRLGATVVRVGDVPIERVIQLLEEANCTVLIAISERFRQITQYAESLRYSLRKLRVRKLICMDTTFRTATWQLNSFGQLLEKIWDAQLLGTFNHLETSTFLSDCEVHKGPHVHPELMFVEVVDQHGRGVEKGEIGECCLTPFGISGMPVIRYRTGCYSALIEDVCDCGRVTPRLGPVYEANENAVSIRGKMIFLEMITSHLVDKGLDRYVIKIEEDHSRQVSISILVSDMSEDFRDNLQNHFWQHLHIPVAFDNVSVEELSRHLKSEQSIILDERKM